MNYLLAVLFFIALEFLIVFLYVSVVTSKWRVNKGYRIEKQNMYKHKSIHDEKVILK